MSAPARPLGRRAARKAAAEAATARSNGAVQPTTAFDFTDEAGHRRVRVAIYIRISTDEAHQPFSLEAQEARLRAYINT
ncbi:MAG TPA: hypothetical protein VNV66_20485, partial [Pilimelia sp.]|nr:hypothetical protein [Pilimelia sp.]